MPNVVSNHPEPMGINPADLDMVSRYIQQLFANKPSHVEQIHSGNSRVYKVSTTNQSWIVKLYPNKKTDPRDRLGTEYGALHFLWQNDLKNIPQPLYMSKRDNLGIYSYINGASPDLQTTKADHIEQAIAFLKRLKDLAKEPNSLKLPTASEACFSVQDYFTSIHKRVKRLDALQPQTPYHAKAKYFLSESFTPLLHKVTQTSHTWMQKHKIDVNKMLSQNAQTLSPSDFGFHNTIETETSELVFLDFEYFGWDDPAKMIVDFLHHPAMTLSPEQHVYFKEQMLTIFQSDIKLSARIDIAYLAFGLKWCLILLNEFLPDILKRRVQANDTYSLDERLNRQLQKVQDKYHDITTHYTLIANA